MAPLPTPGLFGLIVENIGAGEIVVIAFLALVVLGPDRIPEMARGAGRLINKAKSLTSDLTGDMADVINDPAMQPIRELGEFATRPRQKLAEYALEAEAEERQKQTTAEASLDPPEPDTVGSNGSEPGAGESTVTEAAEPEPDSTPEPDSAPEPVLHGADEAASPAANGTPDRASGVGSSDS
ncbi:MAG: twin-arginine translocase TatA/TatE family subunit [Microthrixaceae bacterium]